MLRRWLEREEKKLRLATPLNLRTRAEDYVDIRCALAQFLCRRSFEAVVEARCHLHDVLQRYPVFEMSLGAARMLPWLMLRLDHDQDCYDFVKWWHTNPNRATAHHTFNVLEDIIFLVGQPARHNLPAVGRPARLWSLAAMLLLKLKLLVDVIELKLSRNVVQHRLPPELWSRVDRHAVRSSISKRRSGMSYGDLTALQQRLETDVRLLTRAVQNTDENYLHALFNPDAYLEPSLKFAHDDSALRFVALLEESYPAWWQHEGVLELLRSAMQIADADSVLASIESPFEILTSRTSKFPPTYLRTRESLRVMGYYLAQAAEDVFTPSKVKMSEVRRSRKDEVGVDEGSGEADVKLLTKQFGALSLR
jgi:hypothetical protein